MSQFKSLYLVADRQLRRTPAFERAAWLARASGATLHIALVDHSAAITAVAHLDGRGSEQAREGWLEVRRKKIQEEVAVLKSKGIRASGDAVWGKHPVVEVLAQIEEMHPDLVIKDFGHEGGIKHALMTSVDWNLIRSCPTPVMLVHPLTRVQPSRVVAAVDVAGGAQAAAPFNDEIVKAALGLAIQCQCETHVAYCFDAGPVAAYDAMHMGPSLSGELYDVLLEAHRESFRALTRRYGVPEEQAHILFGHPVAALSDFTNATQPDVLVIGTHRRHGVDRFLAGSTAEAILDRVGSDVLVVKPAAVEETVRLAA